MAVIHISSKADWDKRLEVAKAERRVVIADFHAQWCGPCKMIAPIYESLAKDFPTVYFLKVDVDEVSAVAEALDIKAMPTFLVFVGGERVDDLVGASQEKLKTLVAKHGAEPPVVPK